MTETTISTRTISYRDGGKGRSKAQKRLLLFRKQEGRCAICCRPMRLNEATLDHIVPRGLGGANGYVNLRAAHEKCNHERGSSMDDLFVDASGIRALRWNVKELP